MSEWRYSRYRVHKSRIKKNDDRDRVYQKGTQASLSPASVDVRTVGFVVSFRSCRAIQVGFLLLAMLCSYLVSDTRPLPSLSRSTGYGLVVTHQQLD
jgi:hypothetical protein